MILFYICMIISCDTKETTVIQKPKSHEKSVQIVQKNKGQNTSTNEEENKIDIQESDKPSKSSEVGKFQADDFPITNDLLLCKDNFSICGMAYKDLFSTEKKWFSDKERNETIVIQLYTDKFRNYVYYFSNDEIPVELINRMGLHTKDGKLARKRLKQEQFRGLVEQAKTINYNYFKSNKGFVLGDNIEKALKIYGIPRERTNFEGVEKLYWDFGEKEFLPSRYAGYSIGYEVSMFFKNDQLTGMILHNLIP